ncbi:hypothetical protein [Haloplanus halobius]|uniref:hypothetical protein n=1 Tax=Haloplanus halobius TaxID=2934938 RepID=UPI0020108465|nr:hypothetical protein [Haloplanus sp. XH21]
MRSSPSSRPLRAAVALVVCVGIAGCFGGGAPASPTPTANTDCPPALTVYELDEEPADLDSAVAYENLTAAQQRTFHRARNGSVEDFASAWDDIDVVAYEETYYRASIVVC